MESKDTLSEIERRRQELEVAKLENESRKIAAEREELERKLKRRWYQTPEFLRPVAAALIGFPVIWFFFDNIVQPVYQMENTLLEIENDLAEVKLRESEIELQEQQEQLEHQRQLFDQEKKALWHVWDEEKAQLKQSEERLRALYEKLKQDYREVLDTITDEKALAVIRPAYERLQQRLAPEAKPSVPQFEIENHRLQGPGVEFVETPNLSGKFESPLPDTIVLHFSSSNSLEADVKHMASSTARQSAHLLVGRDGRVVQMVPFDTVAWHAGRSSYGDRVGLNRYSIGIQMNNAGQLTEKDGEFKSWFGRSYPPDEVLKATLPGADSPSYWHNYTAEQVEVVTVLATLLREQYGINTILGHNEISPGRKVDPGPAFPVDDLRLAVLGQADAKVAVGEGDIFSVTAPRLNVRTGPATTYPAHEGGPVPEGTLLRAGKRSGIWRHVDVLDDNGATRFSGWVVERYIIKEE